MVCLCYQARTPVPGLVPGTHVFDRLRQQKAWEPGMKPGTGWV
jgi:hypothetical protein